jgi:hypothetical protein
MRAHSDADHAAAAAEVSDLQVLLDAMTTFTLIWLHRTLRCNSHDALLQSATVCLE